MPMLRVMSMPKCESGWIVVPLKKVSQSHAPLPYRASRMGDSSKRPRRKTGAGVSAEQTYIISTTHLVTVAVARAHCSPRA